MQPLEAGQKGTIHDKGIINNRVTNHLMKMLEGKEGSDPPCGKRFPTETIVKKLPLFPWRSLSETLPPVPFPNGSACRRLPDEEKTVLEILLQGRRARRPDGKRIHILAMEWCTKEELGLIAKYAESERSSFRLPQGSEHQLIDFKLEFGKLSDGTIVPGG